MPRGRRRSRNREEIIHGLEEPFQPRRQDRAHYWGIPWPGTADRRSARRSWSPTDHLLPKAGDLENARDHLKARGIEVAFVAADNTRDEDIQHLADRSIAELGRVDILVNNAGATWAAPTEDHPIEAWDKLMTLNVRAIFPLSQRIGKSSMIPNKYGRILNVA